MADKVQFEASLRQASKQHGCCFSLKVCLTSTKGHTTTEGSRLLHVPSHAHKQEKASCPALFFLCCIDNSASCHVIQLKGTSEHSIQQLESNFPTMLVLACAHDTSDAEHIMLYLSGVDICN
eukprot:gnl/MRDRNA2_/MRDRNA2_85702_c5_seq18.p1 gnl/MRDRNA2_/MRDRNA2_85702_c5~~gnl/MRDRNA2_/MRDRNA2_85702_c5_seq18.p1  ORF type:complete len:122 (-),score=21.61 gnl/MRDRNA2_/MRDRNA2_85702_c5_seq18:123-488(-)